MKYEKEGDYSMISDADMKVLLKAQQGELDAVLMYKKLARVVKDPRDQKTFGQLAREEGHHAAVFHKLTGKTLKPKKAQSIIVPLLYRIIGKKKLYTMIAKGEYAAVDTYAPVADQFPEIESVKNDEHRHGDMVKNLL